MSGTLATDLPALVADAGVWDGTCVHVGVDGTVLDRHRTRTLLRFHDHGPGTCHETVLHLWDDGRREVEELHGDYVPGSRELRLASGQRRGVLRELDASDAPGSRIARWSRLAAPELRATELITVAPDGRTRSRVQPWLHVNGGLERCVVIAEEKVADDWRGFEEVDGEF